MGKLVSLLMVVTACSASDGSARSPLDGIWQAQLQDSCVGTFEFNGSSFTENVLCPFGNSGIGDAYEAGTFTATSATITFSPTESSCVADDVSGTLNYTLQNSQLLLSLPTATIILEKTSAGTVSGGGVVQYGCWNISKTPGIFTPGAIQPI